MSNKVPSGIAQQHIVAAVRDLDRGAHHTFGESNGYVLFEGRHYAPKAVIGLAVGKIIGSPLGPYDFMGGLKSKCFRILEAKGFHHQAIGVVTDVGLFRGSHPHWQRGRRR